MGNRETEIPRVDEMREARPNSADSANLPIDGDRGSLRVCFEVALPNRQDMPALASKGVPHSSVASPVRIQLTTPVGPMSPWKGDPTSAVTMPETSVYEDRGSLEGKDEVGFPGKEVDIHDEILQAKPLQFDSEELLRRSSTIPVRLHHPGNES